MGALVQNMPMAIGSRRRMTPLSRSSCPKICSSAPKICSSVPSEELSDEPRVAMLIAFSNTRQAPNEKRMEILIERALIRLYKIPGPSTPNQIP
jgi:hypothetical protein